MQYCPKCKVSVTGAQEVCPLCQGDLRGAPDEKNIFPSLADRPDKKTGFIFRLMLFIAITAAIVCVAINIMVPTSAWWSLFVVFGIGSACISVGVGYLKKSDIMKNIIWQLCIMLALAVIWDVALGWHGWSIDYVLPCVSGAALITMCLLARLLRLPLSSFASRLLLACLLGLVPAVLLACGALRVVIPSLICSALSIVALCALALFFGPMLRAELHRRLHL